jgi:anti-sigma B factor antagonist
VALRVLVRREAPDWVLEVDGELDVATAPMVADALRKVQLLDGQVTLDLTAVSFMDVAAVHLLIAVRRAADADGGRLRILGPAGGAARVLELTGTLHLVEQASLRRPRAPA